MFSTVPCGRLLQSSEGAGHEGLQSFPRLTIAEGAERVVTQVTVVCRRIGGAFGGKASRAMPVAAAAAVAASKLKRRVRLVLNRNQDMHQNAGKAGLRTEVPGVSEAQLANRKVSSR